MRHQELETGCVISVEDHGFKSQPELRVSLSRSSTVTKNRMALTASVSSSSESESLKVGSGTSQTTLALPFPLFASQVVTAHYTHEQDWLPHLQGPLQDEKEGHFIQKSRISRL